MPPTPVIISQSREAEVDRSILKILLFAFFGIGLNVLSVYLFTQFLLTLTLRNFLSWFITAIVFFVFVVLQTIFIKSFAKLQLVMFLHGIAPVSLFLSNIYPNTSMVIVIGVVVFALSLMNSSGRGLKMLANSLTIKFFQIARAILPRAMTGMLLFLSLLTYFYYFELGKFTSRLGQSIVYEVLSSADPLLNVWFPGASFNNDIDEFLGKVAETELRKMPKNIIGGSATTAQIDSLASLAINPEFAERIDFNALPEPIRAKIIREAAGRIKTSLEEVIGPLPEEQQVKDIIFSIVAKYVADFSANMGWLFSVIVVAAAFFTLRGIFSLFKWLISLIAFILFKFLVITGFAYTNLETRSREFVLLS